MTEGRAIVRVAENGDIAESLTVGTLRPSKPVFAGPNLDRLFVTTISKTVPESDELAGFLLELKSPARGAPIAAAAFAVS